MSIRSPEGTPREGTAGLAHVATMAFVAARAAPPLGFPLSLTGGIALARAGRSRGASGGYGTALAAIIETVAVVGPARLGGPISQALSAPAVGVLAARGAPVAGQIAACAAIRLAYTILTSAFFVFVAAGGLDAYSNAYDGLLGFALPNGPAAALLATVVALAAWALFASAAQVFGIRRAAPHWPRAAAGPAAAAAGTPPPAHARRLDPRAVALAGAALTVILLASASWSTVAAAGVWLALAWVAAAPDPTGVRAGIALAAVLAAGAFAIALLGGTAASPALAHAARAGLIVVTTTWVRGAAGPNGFREVWRRLLRRLGRLAILDGARRDLEDLGTENRMGAAARSLLGAVRRAGRRPGAVVDAALEWIAVEAHRYRPPAPAPPMRLRIRMADRLLVASVILPLAALLA